MRKLVVTEYSTLDGVMDNPEWIGPTFLAAFPALSFKTVRWLEMRYKSFLAGIP